MLSDFWLKVNRTSFTALGALNFHIKLSLFYFFGQALSTVFVIAFSIESNADLYFL